MYLCHTPLVPVALAVAALAATVSAGRAAAEPSRRDVVNFGNRVSEEAHSFSGSQSVAAVGGLGRACRHIPPNGHLTFRFACDPGAPNYLTLELWGSESGNGQLYLFDGDERIGGYQKDWPELDLMGAAPTFPGRFFYSTYLIPEHMTSGQQQVTLRVGSTGHPTPYSRERKEADQKELSRGVYSAAIGTDPFFVPEGGAGGAAPAASPPLTHPGAMSPIQHLHEQLDLAVSRMLRWQWYGDEWDRWVAEGKAPAGLTGGVVTRGARDPKWAPDEWRRQAARRMGGNRVSLLVPEIYARAYHAPWSRYHHDPELVDRVVKALDYSRVAQGNNGGFDDIWAHEWVGGPKRRRAGNCLEGFGHMGLGAAFLELRREIEEGGYLNRAVDEDDDPDTPPVPRRDAWTRLFRGSRGFLTTVRGHAPNQDMANQVAAYLANLCLRELAPEDAWSDAATRPCLDSACGLGPDIYGGRWLSAKGLSCEPHGTSNGGYCGNYGDLTEPLLRLARLTGDPRIGDRALQFAHTLAKFRYMSLDGEARPVVRREGVITWRNNFTPGKVGYGGYPYAAAVLGDALSLRALQLAAAHGELFRVDLDRYWAHLQSTTATLIRNADMLEEALSRPATDARLPFEPGQPDFAWADEGAGAVVVKRGQERLLMSLNWRHGFEGRERSPEDAVVNNIARVHCTTPEIERIANVHMETRDGFGGFYVCRYGPYVIGMNASEETSYALALPSSWSHGMELITGRRLDGGSRLRVPPRDTVVLYGN